MEHKELDNLLWVQNEFTELMRLKYDPFVEFANILCHVDKNAWHNVLYKMETAFTSVIDALPIEKQAAIQAGLHELKPHIQYGVYEMNNKEKWRNIYWKGHFTAGFSCAHWIYVTNKPEDLDDFQKPLTSFTKEDSHALWLKCFPHRFGGIVNLRGRNLEGVPDKALENHLKRDIRMQKEIELICQAVIDNQCTCETFEEGAECNEFVFK